MGDTRFTSGSILKTLEGYKDEVWMRNARIKGSN